MITLTVITISDFKCSPKNVFLNSSIMVIEVYLIRIKWRTNKHLLTNKVIAIKPEGTLGIPFLNGRIEIVIEFVSKNLSLFLSLLPSIRKGMHLNKLGCKCWPIFWLFNCEDTLFCVLAFYTLPFHFPLHIPKEYKLLED